MSQLQELARPFTGKYVKVKPGKGNPQYVEHADITQRLLQVLGPFDFRVLEALSADPVVVRCELSVCVDDRPVTIVELGQSENPQDPWKSAASDGLKRCAMRLGLGLHLWAQDHYFLDKALGDDK